MFGAAREGSTTMRKVKRSAKGFRFVVAVLAALAVPTPILAQPDCEIDQPYREAVGRERLAVWIDGNWQFFAENTEAPAHVLETGTLRKLCLAWEAPPYNESKRQIVYVSTQYHRRQPLLLFRNNAARETLLFGELISNKAASEIPVIGDLASDWEATPSASVDNPKVGTLAQQRDDFRSFHHKAPKNSKDPPWTTLFDWHDTSAWKANHGSYPLVLSTAAQLTLLPYGTERLLVLKKKRDLASWVKFDTRVQPGRNELRVAVSYSGDVDSGGVHVYQYVFEVR